MLVVDIRHWIDENDALPSKPAALRRNALRVAQLIEYGGPLQVGTMRETLVPCQKRPGRQQCPGLLWVLKEDAEHIASFCLVCRQDDALISGWQHTIWADGMMEPISADPDDEPCGPPPTRH